MRPLLFLALLGLNAELVVSQSNSTAARTAHKACQALVQSLGTTKTQTAGTLYQQSATGAWSVFNQLSDPTCIIFPTNSSDVVTAMKAIHAADADYAIRGGGHSGMPGWNTIGDGVLIDFSQMKSYSYDPSRDIIAIEPGVLWGEIYDGLQSQGVAPVGGRAADVGISGLYLGGGLSFLSPAHGYACDTFRSLDVVLTSGELVTATGTNQYADLFKALKGGGNRFGIVTKFEVQAIQTGTAANKAWYGGTISYPNSSILALVQATDNYTFSNTDPNAVMLAAVTRVNISGTFITPSEAYLFYNGTEAQFNATFAQLLAIPSTSTSFSPMSYIDVTKVVPSGSSRANGNIFGASSLYPGQGLLAEAYAHFLNFTTTFEDELYFSSTAFTPVPQSQIDISNANGGTAFSPHKGAYIAVEFNQAFAAGVTTVNADLQNGIDLLYGQIPRSPGVPLYLNESRDKQNAFTTYNWFQQLKAVYAKYDPTGFNLKHVVGPNGL